MKFGVRECANIVFRAKQPIRIGTATFQTGQPVLYIDTATTSSMEQSTTTVYAQGGRGNARLLSWEGEKTLTFSFTDALLSPIGFAILSGAGLFKRGNGEDENEGGDLVHFHMTSGANLEFGNTSATSATATIDLRNAIAEFGGSGALCISDAPIYVMETENDGSLTGRIFSGSTEISGGLLKMTDVKLDGAATLKSAPVMVDYYVDLPGQHVYEADITPETFGGNYYVEADTLFRDQKTGKDLPANLTFPNVRLQSNFTLTFAGTGDPSTFDFTMDAFPDYTYFDRTKKVLCVLQVVDSVALGAEAVAAQADNPVMYHDNVRQDAEASAHDSNITTDEQGANVSTFAWKDGSETGTKAISIPNVNDAISFANFVKVINNGEEVSLNTLRPNFTAAVSSSAMGDVNAFVEVSADGYIVAKKNTNGAGTVNVSAALPAKVGGTTQLTLNLYIGQDVPQG